MIRDILRAVGEDLRAQIPTYGSRGFRRWKFVYNVAAFSGVHALLVFRLSQLFERSRLLPLAYLCRKVLYHFYHADVWGGMEVGAGHWWCHPLGIVYTRHARIGRRVQVFQNVSIVSAPSGNPVIEDFVVLYAGACVIGGVRVGRGAIVGAHAVVTRDVPAYAVVAGNPSRVLRQRWREEVDSEDEVGVACCFVRSAVESALSSECGADAPDGAGRSEM